MQRCQAYSMVIGVGLLLFAEVMIFGPVLCMVGGIKADSGMAWPYLASINFME